MNYHAHYDKLIARSRGRLLECYTERHHIIPRCMGGSDASENIAVLTAAEHYVAHQLLVKMHPGHKGLIFSAKMMASAGPGNRRSGNKMYGWLRKKNSEAMMGNTHSVGRTYSPEQRKQLSEASKGQISWSKGLTKADHPNLAHTEATKKLLSRIHTGKKLSEDHKAAIKASLVGWKPPPQTAEHKRNVAKASRARGKIRATCPHCGLEGSLYPMKQWHFDNCITLKPEGYKRPTYKHTKKRATVKCPHCDKTGDASPMSRWHFDNCKTIKPGYKPRVPIQEVVTCPHCDKSGGISCMKRHHFDNCKKLKAAKYKYASI